MKNRKKLDQWAFELQRDVYTTWLKKYSFWKSGFKIFYGPVQYHPELMIISQNPGGGEKDFLKEDKVRFEAGDFSPQSNHAYANRYRMSATLQDLFGDTVDKLYSSVTFPIIFFRSRNTNELSTIERFTFNEMERFSLMKCKEIIETLRPKRILVIGFKTHQLLERCLGLYDTEEFCYQEKVGRLLARRAEKTGIKILSLIHVTGSRLNSSEKLFMKKLLKTFIN